MSISILALSLTACGPTGPEFAYEGPIEGWLSVALPDSATWDRTVISGPVENHHYNNSLTKAEVFTFLEMAMIENGWVLDADSNSIRNFTNEAGDLINYTVSDSDSGSKILVIIEPYGAYGDPLEEIEPGDTEEAPFAEPTEEEVTE